MAMPAMARRTRMTSGGNSAISDGSARRTRYFNVRYNPGVIGLLSRRIRGWRGAVVAFLALFLLAAGGGGQDEGGSVAGGGEGAGGAEIDISMGSFGVGSI